MSYQLAQRYAQLPDDEFKRLCESAMALYCHNYGGSDLRAAAQHRDNLMWAASLESDEGRPAKMEIFTAANEAALSEKRLRKAEDAARLAAPGS